MMVVNVIRMVLIYSVNWCFYWVGVKNLCFSSVCRCGLDEGGEGGCELVIVFGLLEVKRGCLMWWCVLLLCLV